MKRFRILSDVPNICLWALCIFSCVAYLHDVIYAEYEIWCDFFKVGANQLKTVKYAANVKPQPTRGWSTFTVCLGILYYFNTHYNPWQPSTLLIMWLFLRSQTLHEALVPVYQGTSSSHLFLTPLMNWVRAKQSFHWDHTFNQLLPLERQTVVNGSLTFVILLRQIGNTCKVYSPHLTGSADLFRWPTG